MKKQSFNKFNPQDLFSQLVKVLSQKDTPEMRELIKDLKSLSSKVYRELKNTGVIDSILQEANIKET